MAISATRKAADGDKPLAAHVLEISKTTMYRKLQEYGWQDRFADKRSR
ncbi:MAG TPA: helix-turn-helix domain-containing protein [Candidatus Angelobacter sp.]